TFDQRHIRLASPRSAGSYGEAAALAPQSRYLDIAGGGHAPFLGHADQVAQEVQQFMRHPQISTVGAT
ncbi:MAG TPA: hypothetical protein VLF15_06440, partial [Pseudoxanthomonas sp.]|nr:hypothetical protein [Pseudoxanthomonas sp.]